MGRGEVGGRLKGKAAIVTGAGSGIGRATAVLFASEGCQVCCADWNEESCAETATMIAEKYGQNNVMTAKVDVANEADMTALVAGCERRFGRFHVFFANAGVSGMVVPFSDISTEDFEFVFRTNVLGVFLSLKAAADHFRRHNIAGSIICTSSVAGLRSGAGPTHYSASKAAVISMVQTVANQLAGTGIRVNAICPGLIETGMTKPLYDMARERGTVHRIGQLNPLRRGGEPEEVANVVLFLASDASSYVNGQFIPVCGGLSSGHPIVFPGSHL